MADGRDVVARGVRAGPAADGGGVGARVGGGVDSGDDNDVACEPVAVDPVADDPVAAVDVVVGSRGTARVLDNGSMLTIDTVVGLGRGPATLVDVTAPVLVEPTECPELMAPLMGTTE